MRVRVIKSFKDKRTKEIYQPGQDIEVIKERYEELTSAALGPFVQEITSPEPPQTKAIKEGRKQRKSR